MNAPAKPMTVTQVVQETHNTRTFRLEPVTVMSCDWLPGQFIMVNFPDDPKSRRAYSLSSSPLDGPHLEFTVKRMGHLGTRLYDEAKPGTTFDVIPPVGKFLLPSDPSLPVMLISGGTGITPYRGMMRYILQRSFPTRVINLHSARSPEDIVFHDDFERMCALNPRFTFVVTCTRLPPDDVTWTGPRGRIGWGLIQQLTPDPDRTVYYVCGSHEFVADIAATLHAAGMPHDRIRYEDWG